MRHESPQEIAVRALRNMQGDDVLRARAAFRGMTPDEMQQPYGQSGKTCRQVLDEYEAAHREIAEAIAWVESQP